MKNEDIKRIALESGFELKDLPDGSKGLRPYVFEFAQALLAAERQAVADICDELEQHWSEYKDAALLNGDVALSNAASGEPRAARAIKAAVLARNGKPWELFPTIPPEHPNGLQFKAMALIEPLKEPPKAGMWRCIGGPLDGELRQEPAGRSSFRVTAIPPASLTEPSAIPEAYTAQMFEYRLEWSAERGAWVWRNQG